MAEPQFRILPRTGDDRPILDAHGLIIVVPSGWEIRIRKQAPGEEDEGASSYPVVHAATVPLPPGRGDYGSSVVERLTSGDVFVSLVEFGPDAVDTALFPSVDEFPTTIEPSSFHPRQLQRVIPGQAGTQVFFTFRERAFCLYVVLGSYAMANQLVPVVEDLLASIAVASP